MFELRALFYIAKIHVRAPRNVVVLDGDHILVTRWPVLLRLRKGERQEKGNKNDYPPQWITCVYLHLVLRFNNNWSDYNKLKLNILKGLTKAPIQVAGRHLYARIARCSANRVSGFWLVVLRLFLVLFLFGASIFQHFFDILQFSTAGFF